ncbi:hypothetical protein [Thalassospira sp. CH_XMU1420-2]|uniref:hypothetical protein n=1 Tax=Thalassospira sp. CH_XMU1420-2 TaxID=3107769 RepID=UPI00300BD700
MEDLEVVRTIDVVYEFTEPLLPYTLAGTFLLTVLLVGCPLTAPYFSEMRRATSDFRWVAMSLLSLAVVLWHSGYISRTQNAFWALETQRSL